jgi:anti-sigma B factor antagonist
VTPSEEVSFVDLSLARRTHGDWVVVEVGGELDLYTAPSFRDSVLEGASEGPLPKVIVDFDRLGFIDSSGLGAIVACLKNLRVWGDGKTRGGGGNTPPSPAPEDSGIRRLLQLTGLDRVLTVHASVEDVPTTS